MAITSTIKELISQDWDSRREKLKNKKLKNTKLCQEWKIRESAGLNESGQRQSHWIGAGASPSFHKG